MEPNNILQAGAAGGEGALCDLKDVGGYIAYVSLDFLDTVFLDGGFLNQPEKQQEYIDNMQKQLAEVVLNHDKHSLMMSWSWTDKEGQTRRAVELMPVAASAHGLQIVTPDVTGYQQLRDKITELETENFRLRQQMRDIGEHMKTNNIITERAFRAYFNREPGNLVEQFRKDSQPPTREQLEQERKQREEHLKRLRDAMSAEYAKSYVRGILTEQIEAEEQRLKEIEAELEKHS